MWGEYRRICGTLKNIVNWKCQITNWDVHAKIIWAFSPNQNLICNYKIKSEYCVLELCTNLLLSSADFFYIAPTWKKFAPISNNWLFLMNLIRFIFCVSSFALLLELGLRILRISNRSPRYFKTEKYSFLKERVPWY